MRSFQAAHVLEFQGVGAVLGLVDALLRLHPTSYTATSGPEPQLAQKEKPEQRQQSQTEQQQQQQQQQQHAQGSSSSGDAATHVGFAMVRPPGHHVLAARPMGFGLLSTIAIAAKYLQRVHGIHQILIFGGCGCAPRRKGNTLLSWLLRQLLCVGLLVPHHAKRTLAVRYTELTLFDPGSSCRL